MDPSSIPPPLPASSNTTDESASRGDTQKGAFIDRDRTEWIGIIVAVGIGLLLSIACLVWFRDGSGGSSTRGQEAGLAAKEGVLAGESTDGKTSENGQDTSQESDANREARTKSGQDMDQEFSDSRADDRSVTNGTDPDLGGSSNSDGKSEEEQSEATLVLVPNRQNRQAAGSRMGPNRSGSGVGAGLDLTSTKGLNPFVGEGKPAVSTVFVIDVSGSMRNQDRLPRVMNALTRAIDQLSDKQEFCVLLFDSTFYSAPWVTGLTAGTADNKRRIKAWLAQPPGGGGTEPMGAMAAAIELRPERIVLLSDGEFDPTNILTITSMNHQLKTPARIDCVGLQEDVLVLREIANKNKGIYYQAW